MSLEDRILRIRVESLRRNFEWALSSSGLILDENSEVAQEFALDQHRCLVDSAHAEKSPLYIELAPSGVKGYTHDILAASLEMMAPAGGQCGKRSNAWEIGFINGDTQLSRHMTRVQFEQAANNGIYILTPKTQNS